MKNLLLPLALFAGTAHASDWQHVASQGSSFFSIDFDSIATSGGYKKAWIKGEYYKAQETTEYPKKQYQSTKSLYYFDCGAKLIGSVQFIAYEKLGGQGEIILSSSGKFNPKDLNEVIPDTVGETFLTVACGSPAARLKIKKENDANVAAAERAIKEVLREQKAEAKARGEDNSTAAQRRMQD